MLVHAEDWQIWWSFAFWAFILVMLTGGIRLFRKLVATIDYFLHATPYHTYYFSDNPSYELSGAFFHFFMYPSASILFLFIYEKWRLHGWKTVVYVLGWSAFAPPRRCC